jgi:transcriptional regulator PpsR
MIRNLQNPELNLAQADARAVARLAVAASDLTLVLDGGGIIRDLAHNLAVAPDSGILGWRGLPIEEVVRVSSRPVLKKALHLARAGAQAERFDVNHLMRSGRDLPMQYAALALGADGGVMLMGRDLSLVAELKSRLLENRQSLLENARSQKQVEAHYRLLFETGAEATVIVDATTGKVREANPRAAILLGLGPAGAGGRRFASLFDKARQGEIQALLAATATSGSPAIVRVDGEPPFVLSAELFRAGDMKLIMIRISGSDADADTQGATASGIEHLVRSASEAVVLTGEDGKVVWANESFLELADIALASHVYGKGLEEFLQWSAVDQQMLFQNVRRHGRVPAFSAAIRGAGGRITQVELSAVAMPEGTLPGFGFVMRAQSADVARRAGGNSDLARAAEKLVEMIGSVPMKDLVRDTTDVIERMCIEAALKLTGNNRASAARVLGLSRQALYLKMDRLGIAEGDDD